MCDTSKRGDHVILIISFLPSTGPACSRYQLLLQPGFHNENDSEHSHAQLRVNIHKGVVNLLLVTCFETVPAA